MPDSDRANQKLFGLSLELCDAKSEIFIVFDFMIPKSFNFIPKLVKG